MYTNTTYHHVYYEQRTLKIILFVKLKCPPICIISQFFKLIVRQIYCVYGSYIADITNKLSCALTVPNNKINLYNIYDAHLIIFTIYLFSCVKFSWIQPTLKVYYC